MILNEQVRRNIRAFNNCDSAIGDCKNCKKLSKCSPIINKIETAFINNDTESGWSCMESRDCAQCKNFNICFWHLTEKKSGNKYQKASKRTETEPWNNQYVQEDCAARVMGFDSVDEMYDEIFND